ncbi:MAG TPA: ABC transporter ATP-binding protein [Pyrinomonadaceae bacterium]|nr:ABC transporter ATP-binding protein [Pyrinomonadaceae bacterium]
MDHDIHITPMSFGKEAVTIIGLSKSFGAARVLQNVSFSVDEDEIVVLLGASGSGKTTILRIIAGLDLPDSGRVILHGKDVTQLPARQRGVGVIFQSYALFPKMNVENNIAYGLRIRRRKRAQIKETVDRLIELVHLDDHRKKYPSQLSGGQQQRVAIARALAYEPEVLLFDEPFGALDAQIRGMLRREIRSLLKEIKVPSIFITHDQEEALELGDRIAVLNAGRLEQIGTPFEIYNNPRTEHVATFLGAANLIEGTVKEQKFSHRDIWLELDDDSKLKDGDDVTLVFRPEDVFLRKPENLTQHYHRLTSGVVDGVSFVGAFERVTVSLNLGEQKTITVTRPKTETTAFPLAVGQNVIAGLVRYRILKR